MSDNQHRRHFIQQYGKLAAVTPVTLYTLMSPGRAAYGQVGSSAQHLRFDTRGYEIANGAIVLRFTVGQPVDVTLPEAVGDVPLPHRYSITRTPKGLSFDPETRKITGSPTRARQSKAWYDVDTSVGRFSYEIRFIVAPSS